MKEASVVVRFAFDTLGDGDGWGRIHLFLFPRRHKYLVDWCVQYFWTHKTCQDLNTLSLEEPTLLLHDEISYYRHYYFRNNGTSFRIADVNETFLIFRSDVWYVYIFNCELTRNDEKGVLINGVTTFENPFGFLPGGDIFLIPCYIFFSCCWLLATILWILFCRLYASDLMYFQRGMRVVLLFGAIESLLTLARLLIYNSYNSNSTLLALGAIICGGAKRTYLRAICILVAYGHRITTDETTVNMVAFTIVTCLLYLVYSCGLEVAAFFSDQFIGLHGWHFILMIPAWLLDGFVYSFTLYALYRTIQTVEIRNESAKLAMYYSFSTIMLGSCVVTTVYAGTFGMATVWELQDEYWNVWWLWEYLWQLLYFLACAFLCYIWKPNSTNFLWNYHRDAPFIVGDKKSQEILRKRRIKVMNIDDDDEDRKQQPQARQDTETQAAIEYKREEGDNSDENDGLLSTAHKTG